MSLTDHAPATRPLTFEYLAERWADRQVAACEAARSIPGDAMEALADLALAEWKQGIRGRTIGGLLYEVMLARARAMSFDELREAMGQG